jgi:hypothetical protein
MQRVSCWLPGGYWDASGVLHREAELEPLTGRDEELLSDKSVSPAALVTSLLARCVARIGAIAPVTEDVARALLVGDRQFLLLKLRQLTFGDRVDATVRCPWPGCGESVDVDFKISEVPIKEVDVHAAVQEMELSPIAAVASGLGAESARARYRLPNGEDQELLTPLLATNEAEAATQLLGRCLLGIGQEESLSVERLRNLSPAARYEIERHMESVAPGIDLTLEAQCPHCARAFPLPFDVQDFIFGDARVSHDLLYREIHYLDMARDKRRRYIEILADEMERLNHAAG